MSLTLPFGLQALTSVRDEPTITAAHRSVAATMHEALGRLDPRLREVALEHMGWADGGGDLRLPGKGLRSVLSLTACDMVAGDPARGVVAGACVELIHESTLVHDDVMDVDELRRGRPAIWVRHGVPTAMLLGTALSTLALEVVVDRRPDLAGRATGRWTRVLHDLVAGQNADLRLSQLPPGEASVAEWELMAEQKSGALIGAAMALGALAGGADEQVADAFDRCGRVLGVAYQVADDVLAVWGDAAVTGKPTAVQPSARLYPLVASGGRLAETSDPAAPCRELLEGTPAREACSSAVARLTDEGLALLADVPDAGGVGSWLQAMLAALANRSS